MATKPNIRSIRFSDELAELIDRQAGNTFTEKFENLVTRCVWELPQKEAELKNIQGGHSSAPLKMDGFPTGGSPLGNLIPGPLESQGPGRSGPWANYRFQSGASRLRRKRNSA